MVVLLSVGAVFTRRRRVATGDGAASPSFAQRRFGIPTGMEDALDEHRVDRDNEGDSDPSFEPGYAQSGQNVIAEGTPQRKGCQSVAEIDDAIDIVVRPFLSGMRQNICV